MTFRCLLILTAALMGLLQGCLAIDDNSLRTDSDTLFRSTVDFNDPVLNNRQILLFGEINERIAEATVKKLLFLDAQNQEPIDLYLMTPGGDQKAFFAIERIMRLISSRVNTYALSECNSGGVVLLAGGTGKRKAFRDAIIVVHGITVRGKMPSDVLEKIQDSYTHFWRQKARLPESWLPLPPGKVHALTAEQALRYGIIDELIDK